MTEKLNFFAHRRHGTPESDRLAVVTQRTAGGCGSAWSPVLCVLFLAGAGLAARLVPHADANQREWQAAVPCTASTPTEDRRECLTTIPAEIERTDDDGPKRCGRLYFADDRPLDRLRVSQEAAQQFEPGDQVELTVRRGGVMEVAGSRYTWREHVTVPGDLAAVSAGLALAAGYPAAQMLMRPRGRRLPDDEVLPSGLPFAAVLVGTGMWLLPLCCLHPTTLLRLPGDPRLGGRGRRRHPRHDRLGLARHPHPYTGGDRRRRSRGAGGRSSCPPASWSPPATTRTASAPTSPSAATSRPR